jgi:hypothetical protein
MIFPEMISGHFALFLIAVQSDTIPVNAYPAMSVNIQMRRILYRARIVLLEHIQISLPAHSVEIALMAALLQRDLRRVSSVVLADSLEPDFPLALLAQQVFIPARKWVQLAKSAPLEHTRRLDQVFVQFVTLIPSLHSSTVHFVLLVLQMQSLEGISPHLLKNVFVQLDSLGKLPLETIVLNAPTILKRYPARMTLFCHTYILVSIETMT